MLVLCNVDFQLEIFDVFVGVDEEKQVFCRLFEEWKQVLGELRKLWEFLVNVECEQDFLQFQFSELEVFQLDRISYWQLELELLWLENVDEFRGVYVGLVEGFYLENGVID